MLLILWTLPAAEDPDLEGWMAAYGDSLTRLCFLYLKDYHAAEEAVQDTFCKAYTRYASFRGEASVKTWLTRIAINTCKDYRRRPACRLAEKFERIPLELAAEEPAAGEGDELLQAVYALPEPDRKVILLRYYSGLSVAEIAQILRKKPNAVSAQLRRARERLRQSCHTLTE